VINQIHVVKGATQSTHQAQMQCLLSLGCLNVGQINMPSYDKEVP